MSSYLQSVLSLGTRVVLDSAHHADINVSALVAQDLNVILTPSSVLEALSLPEHQLSVQKAIDSVLDRTKRNRIQMTFPAIVDLVMDQTLVEMGAVQILWRLPRGRTALYISPSVASDEAAILIKARNLVHVAEHNGVSKSRLLITIPATFQGISAAKTLKEEDGIDCNMSMVFSTAQAIACAQANIAWISPCVTAIEQWHQRHDSGNPFYDPDDIRCHRGVIYVKRMAQIFKARKYTTQIVPGSFSSVEEIIALAGLPMICMTTEQLRTLEKMQGMATNNLDQVRGINLPRDQISLPAHMRPAPNATPESYTDMKTFYEALQEEGVAWHLLPEEMGKWIETDSEIKAMVESFLHQRSDLHEYCPLF